MLEAFILAQEEADGGGNALIDVVPGLMIWTIVTFVIVLFGIVIYLFEVGIVVSIQAFVFALLSAIYIGGAIEPEH